MRILIAAATLTLTTAFCGCANEHRTAADAGDGHGGAYWDYSDSGPQSWGELSPDYVLASLGGSQSPVNIDTSRTITADLPPLELETRPVPLRFVNNGHTVEVVCPGGATLRFGDAAYELQQLHFHSPSEHTIDGEHAEVELHLVFSDGAGHLAVLGILCEPGSLANDDFITLLGEESAEVELLNPGEEWSSPDDRLDVAKVLPPSLAYYTYDGSLTTPPATEGVRWFVLKEPNVISQWQLDRFNSVYYRNSRPVQPLNSRLVLTTR